MSEGSAANRPDARERPEYVARSRNPLARLRSRQDDSTAVDAAGQPRRPARNRMLTAALATLFLLIGLLLLALLLSNAGLLRLPFGAATVPTPELILDEEGSGAGVLGGNATTGAGGPPTPVAGPVAPPIQVQPADPFFAPYHAARGGETILGYAIGPMEQVNGRWIQWFERARLEYHPELAGTPYEVQLGRIGAEYTQGRSFPRQTYFVSTPDLRYFPETGYAVGGPFLAFYDRSGGLDSFGFPISEAFDEVLADGRTYRVQYFERARMEYHPELAGTPYEVQLGLLGTALMRNDPRPATAPPAPTAVPMP